jgi:hypothetical protein
MASLRMTYHQLLWIRLRTVIRVCELCSSNKSDYVYGNNTELGSAGISPADWILVWTWDNYTAARAEERYCAIRLC